MLWRRYQRPFKEPLRTAHGEWARREGFLVRVDLGPGRIGFGEIAPLPEFGTEDCATIERLLTEWSEQGVAADSFAAMDWSDLPATGFGVSAALAMAWGGTAHSLPAKRIAALLPAGEAALSRASEQRFSRSEFFKWKIGVCSPEREQAILRDLIAVIPAGARLRLDSNGGLTGDAFKQWLTFLNNTCDDRIDYFEQPLPSGEEEQMREIAQSFQWTDRVALDESICRKGGKRWLQLSQWAGPVVVKPSLLGPVETWVPLLEGRSGASVTVSSAFETDIGVMAALAAPGDVCAGDLTDPGIDTVNAFTDTLNTPSDDSLWQVKQAVLDRCEAIWAQVSA